MRRLRSRLQHVRRAHRGAAAVEAALVVTLILGPLFLGVLHFGYQFWKEQPSALYPVSLAESAAYGTCSTQEITDRVIAAEAQSLYALNKSVFDSLGITPSTLPNYLSVDVVPDVDIGANITVHFAMPTTPGLSGYVTTVPGVTTTPVTAGGQTGPAGTVPAATVPAATVPAQTVSATPISAAPSVGAIGSPIQGLNLGSQYIVRDTTFRLDSVKVSSTGTACSAPVVASAAPASNGSSTGVNASSSASAGASAGGSAGATVSPTSVATSTATAGASTSTSASAGPTVTVTPTATGTAPGTGVATSAGATAPATTLAPVAPTAPGTP